MPQDPPELVAINDDEYSAKHIGRTSDGRQFFLTNPFVPAGKSGPGREFIALYLFDDDGRLLEALIDDLGTRSTMDRDAAQRLYDERLAQLGECNFCRIEVQPFRLERFGVEFGFILRPPEEDDDGWWVVVQPGDYMAFTEPWDSGDYDT